MSAALQKAWKQTRRPHLPERALQAQVFVFLRLALPPDAVAFCVPNGDGKVTTAPGTLAGVPDIQIIYRGRPIFIELKAHAGRVSEHQAEVHTRLTGAGAVVAVCRSLEDVDGFLGQIVPLRARAA